MTPEEFERYVKDDTERWTAVHARITGLMWIVLAVADGMETDALIARLLRVQDLVRKADLHPAVQEQVNDLLAALDPRQDSKGPSSERH